MIGPELLQRLRETLAQPGVTMAWAIGDGIRPVREGGVEDVPPPQPRSNDVLPFYVIFNRPSDFPDGWIMRRQDLHLPTQQTYQMNLIYVAKTLEECRFMLPPGLTNIGRQPQDDAKIHEVWI